MLHLDRIYVKMLNDVNNIQYDETFSEEHVIVGHGTRVPREEILFDPDGFSFDMNHPTYMVGSVEE